MDFNGTESPVNVTLSAGDVGGTGTATITGTMDWTGGTINATGTLIIAGAMNASVPVALLPVVFDNNGIVNLNGSLFILNGGGTASGLYSVASGTTLKFTQSYDLTSTSALTGAGTVIISGAGVVVTIDGGYTIPTTEVFNGDAIFNTGASLVTVILGESGGVGQLDVNDTLTVTGTLTCINGALAGDGTTVIASGATLSITALTLSTTLDNFGTAGWSDAGSGDLGIDSEGTFFNEVSGTFADSPEGGAMIDVPAGVSGGIFINSGTYLKNGGTTDISVFIDNTLAGSINVTGGTLILDNGSCTGGGGILVGSEGGLQVPGVETIVGNVVNYGTLSINTLTIVGNVVNNGILSGGTLTITGDLTNNASLTVVMVLLDGNEINSGTLSIEMLSMSGNFAQAATGSMTMPLAGSVSVNGSAALGGVLTVINPAGFSPTPGSTFSLITYTTYSGSFSAVGVRLSRRSTTRPTSVCWRWRVRIIQSRTMGRWRPRRRTANPTRRWRGRTMTDRRLRGPSERRTCKRAIWCSRRIPRRRRDPAATRRGRKWKDGTICSRCRWTSSRR